MGASEGADHTISVGVAFIPLTRLDPKNVPCHKDVLLEFKTHQTLQMIFQHLNWFLHYLQLLPR